MFLPATTALDCSCKNGARGKTWCKRPDHWRRIAKKNSHRLSSLVAIRLARVRHSSITWRPFEKALAASEKMLPTAPMELLDRCNMYISTCQRQLDKHKLTFLTPEEHYDYGISQLNTGYFEEAREQFDGILNAHPGADYAYYGLALLDAITGRTLDCLNNLSRAIELNPRNRLQARADNDFQSMVDDPRFTELLYPEIP
jgi:tetratricopeptide (TPR) repeat protein